MSNQNTIENRCSLAYFVNDLHTEVDRFAELWLKGYAKYPKHYPLEMKSDNLGSWSDQFYSFYESGKDFSECEIQDDGAEVEVVSIAANCLENPGSLAHFTQELHNDIWLFEQNWLRENEVNPEIYPLVMNEDNLGTWLEAFVFERDQGLLDESGLSPK